MAEAAEHLNPAELASVRALEEVYGCLNRRDSFLVEAGAGAGKTYTLVKALHFLIGQYKHILPKRHQKIACITFTNVAKDEIEARTGRSALIYTDTIHGFCWSLIGGFQRQLQEQLPHLRYWRDRIDDIGNLGERTIKYDLGHRNINDYSVSIHHDDVLALTIDLMNNIKFRHIVTSKFPIILIDEYQDTNIDWIDSIKTYFLGAENSPLFGFFGDHWQKIYGYGCGKLDHPSLTVIGKQANFRSVSTVVDCLNRMRPSLPQSVVDPNERGSVRIFHTNQWEGVRQTGGHWGGDLPPDDAHRAFECVQNQLTVEGWEFSPNITKILMLTHTVLAGKQGYPSVPQVFRFNDSFTRKEHPHIAFFSDILEPACESYIARKYGEMFRVLGTRVPAIRSHADKNEWAAAMDDLIAIRVNGTVGGVVDHLLSTRRPKLPDGVLRREHELQKADPDSDEEISRVLRELNSLRAVPYQEIVALCRYLSGHSPFETKHGVKGAEFENVLVVVGRGWNRYNFNEMLEFATDENRIPARKQAAFERNRNLFYVTCSRPRRRLAVLFTQHISEPAMQTISNWFGTDAIRALDF